MKRINMAEEKRDFSFLDYDEQIALLEKKGLRIPDRDRLLQLLRDIGYYELINGYKGLLKNGKNGQFRQGTTPDDILALYKCDENLRELFLKYILRIEIRLRSMLSYAFTDTFGASQNAYLDSAHYTDDKAMKGEVKRLISELKRLAGGNSGADYIRYYQQNYHGVPLWVLFKVVSTGTLVRFYRCSVPKVKKAVISAYPSLRDKTMETMLLLLTRFRNVCAHNDCLYACRANVSLPPMPVLADVHLSVFETEGGIYEGNDLFAVLVTFYYLLSPEDFEKCKANLSAITEHFFSVCPGAERSRFLDAMGFPEDWIKLGTGTGSGK